MTVQLGKVTRKRVKRVMFVSYNMPILGTSSQVLDRAVNAGILERVDESYSGCAGQTYAIADTDDLRWHDEFALTLRGQYCQVNLYALPTAEYLALLQAGDGIQAFDLSPLIEALTSGQADSQIIAARLPEVVRRDKLPANPTLYETPYTAIWLSQGTRFCLTAHGWYLILTFETRGDCRPSIGGKAAFGIDIGVSPVITAVDTRGNVTQLDPPPVIPVERALRAAQNARETHLIQRIAHEAQYTVVRQRLEALIVELIEHATVVVVEDLDLDGFKRSQRRNDLALRNLGMIDFLQAWLPQRLGEHGIPLYREPAEFTSQLCSRCTTRSTRPARTGRQFRCNSCGYESDIHVNAATTLAQLGLTSVLREMQAQLRRPHGGEAADD